MNYNIEYNFPYFVKFGIFKKFGGNPSWGFTYEVTSKPVYIGVLKQCKIIYIRISILVI